MVMCITPGHSSVRGVIAACVAVGPALGFRASVQHTALAVVVAGESGNWLSTVRFRHVRGGVSL